MPQDLLLGNVAYDGAIATVTAQRANFAAWEGVSRGADFHRDVVMGDDILTGNLDDLDPQVDAHHLLHERHQQHETGPFHPLETTEVKTAARSYSRRMFTVEASTNTPMRTPTGRSRGRG